MAGKKASSSSGSGEGKKESNDAWEAVSIVLRIAVVGLSLASAITTLTASSSTQCVVDDGSPASSSTDYGSFTYSSVASLVSALLQGVVICLEVVGEEKWASTVEFIDAVVMALTSTSAPLLLAADNITSCGPPRGRGRNNGARRQNKSLDEKLRPAAGFITGALIINVVHEVVAKPLMKHNKAAPTTIDDCPTWSNDYNPPTGGEDVPQSKPPPSPPCSCSCPTVTPPCCCENRDPCCASTWS